MNALRHAAWLAGLGSSAVALLGCPEDVGCANYTDCRAGQTCDVASGTCVADPGIGGGPRDGGIDVLIPDAGPGGDAGVSERQLRTSFDVPWLRRNPLPGASDQLLFPDVSAIDGVINAEQLVALDPATGQTAGVVLDLLTTTEDFCATERILHFTETAVPETWLSCRQEPGLRVIYNGDFEQPSYNYSGIGAELYVLTGPAFANDWRRVLLARRGASGLTSFQLRETDGVNQPHIEDVVEPSFGEIGGIFLLDRANLQGDFVVVFDRAWPGVDPPAPALVPLERLSQSETWALASTSPIQPLVLDPATHLVTLLSPPRANGQSADPNVPNVMTLEPRNGVARYYNLEVGAEIAPFTRFETDSRFLVEAPDAEERILLDPAPSGDHVFYALPTAYRVWRIPTTTGGDNQVRFYELVDQTWRPSGLVAYDEERAWISYDNENLIELVRTVPR